MKLATRLMLGLGLVMGLAVTVPDTAEARSHWGRHYGHRHHGHRYRGHHRHHRRGGWYGFNFGYRNSYYAPRYSGYRAYGYPGYRTYYYTSPYYRSWR